MRCKAKSGLAVAAHPLPSAPIKGEVPIAFVARGVAQAPAHTSPLMGADGRGWSQVLVLFRCGYA